LTLKLYKMQMKINKKEVPYFLSYKVQHFFKENILVQSKSAPNSGCV